MSLISWNRKPQRGLIEVASQFIGWYQMAKNMRAFRYATSNPYRVPTARNLSMSFFPFRRSLCAALFFIFHYSLFTLSAQSILMRDVFASMPDTILPMVTKNNRLDCIDYIDNNMEAKARNTFGEYVTLEALTADYARFRTSSASLLEMKLLPLLPAPLPTDTTAADTTFVLCLVSTAQTGEPDTPRRLEDSNIRFLRPDWSPLDSLAVPFYLPPFTSFIEGQAPDSLRATYDSALRSLDSFHPVRLALSAESTTLTATLQPAYLAKDEREAITPYLRPLTFIWNGTNFAVEP